MDISKMEEYVILSINLLQKNTIFSNYPNTETPSSKLRKTEIIAPGMCCRNKKKDSLKMARRTILHYPSMSLLLPQTIQHEERYLSRLQSSPITRLVPMVPCFRLILASGCLIQP
jgi:hypothetical protein